MTTTYGATLTERGLASIRSIHAACTTALMTCHAPQ
jgi:hypothetical protein